MSLLNSLCERDQGPLLWIKLLRLDLMAVIGIFPEERLKPQSLSVELHFAVSCQDWVSAGTTGELERSLDYSKVLSAITGLVTFAHFRLLESLYFALAYLFLRTPHHSESRVSLAALKIKLIKMNALSATGSPHPVLEGTLTQEDWLSLEKKLSSFAPLDATSYSTMHIERSDPLEMRLVLDLPELRLYHLMSDREGELLVRATTNDLIPLSHSVTSEHTEEYTCYSWSTGLSALYIVRS